MEKEFKVNPVGIKYTCDSCNTGEMLPTGKMNMLEFKATYTHVCNNCGTENNFNEKYPLIRYTISVDKG